MDYSFLPPLSAQLKGTAIRLDLKPYAPLPGLANPSGWDNAVYYSTNQQYAILSSTFVVNLQKGATYDFASSSYFDPFILELYDSTGKVIAVDEGAGTYGYDYIFNFVPTASGDYYISASWDQGLASTHRYSSVSVYENVDTIPKAAAPATQYGTSGVDLVALSGPRSGYSFKLDGQNVTLSQSGQADKKFVYVERFAFADVVVATDIQGNAGKAYRLYEAAFDRAPDSSGLGFWIKALDSGVSLQTVAQGFVGSKEFKGLYGDQISQNEFVSALYGNVLGRAPDAEGANFWITALNNGASRAQVLAGFSESPENQQGVIGAIQNGIQYEFWT